MTRHVRRVKGHFTAARRPRGVKLPLVIDLFSGAGGLSLGFEKAGFQIVQAIEADPRAAATFALNHPNTDVINADIRDLDPIDCLRRIGRKPSEVSAVIGGPPCQGFSESNRRTRTLDNERNYLYKEFLRFVRAIKPEWVVLENVAGLATLKKGVLLKRIVTGLRRAGYNAQWQMLNAAEHGVPQIRRRLFIIARRKAKPLPGPFLPSHRCEDGFTRYVTVKEAIGDLPILRNGASVDSMPYRTIPSKYASGLKSAPNGSSGVVSGNLVTKSAPLVLKRYNHIAQGGNWESIPASLMRNYLDRKRCHTGIYHRLAWNEPSKVVGNFRKNMVIHPTQNRGLSVREAARLQSFPDHYQFTGSIGFQQQQVADAVPPVLAGIVAHALLTT